MFAESVDDDQIIARVAALDVGKAEIVCCVRLPAPAGRTRRVQEVTTHSTMVGSLNDLATGRTDTFLGARYRRITRRRGKKKAIVAVGRSVLIIVWHLLADPNARFKDLGSDYYDNRISTASKTRNHIRGLESLGYTVTIQPAA